MKALARYAVIAGAVLPFLPNGHYGPLGAWNPQKLWLVVVLVTGFSFLGYVANRIFGERHGTIATALIGGAYSSTAVTQSLAQRLGSEEQGGAEPAGIALATAVMYLRVLLLIGVLATRVFVPFALILLPGGHRRLGRRLLALPHGARSATRRHRPAIRSRCFRRSASSCSSPSPRSPPNGRAGRFGEQGIAVLLLIVGITDVDTAIITLGGLPPTRSRRCSRRWRSPARSSSTWR